MALAATSPLTLNDFLDSDRFRPITHVVWARFADTMVLLDTERGQYHTLNEVATRIWELLVAGEPIFEIRRALSDEYDAPAETIQGDIAALLEQLLASGLIERAI